MTARVAIVVAMDRNRLIGAGNRLPWRIPEDLRRFRRLTMGKPLIMGRLTHESIGRPLDGRTNIVLTRGRGAFPGCRVASGLDEALAIARAEPGVDEIAVIGGAEVYAQALPLAARIHLTELDAEFEGDAWFPAWREQEWEETGREDHPPAGDRAFGYRNVTLDRRSPAPAR